MSLTLLDWRRRTASLYGDVRAATDPEQGWRRWRAGRDELFASHPESPRKTAALAYSPYDPAWRFAVALDASTAGEELRVATADDGEVVLRRLGLARLPVGGLDVWWIGGYGGGVFVPLADATNGHTTYGGGRYVLDTIKGADLGSVDDRLVLDLNFAYHPSCAYDDRWSCPLAPAGNRLAVPVEAGELLA